MLETVDQLISHLRVIWRYRWYAVSAAWIIALGGWTAVYLVPDRYEAYARVFVDTHSMLRPLLTGIAVQPNVDQMVTMMGRTLVSRANVEKVIHMNGMDAGRSPEDREKLIAHLATGLAIKSAGPENIYTISYGDQDREQAKRVVQSLLTIFMEGSLGDKRKDSDSARQFIDEQLKSYGEKLVAAENAVTEFKRRHQGTMPDEKQDYYARLGNAKDALRRATLELKEALQSRDAIKQQLASEAQTSSQPSDKGTAIVAPTEIDGRIQALEQKLDGLRLTYTEEHPDIVALARTVDQLKAQKIAESKAERRAPAAPQGKVLEQLSVSLAVAEAHVAAMKVRVQEYTERYGELQAAANALPQVEAEFKQLTRDYEVIKARYDKLLERRESAQISGDVEASDVAIEFRVIDPPQVPPAPAAPKRTLLNSLVLLAALGGGLAIALLVGQVKLTFDDARSLREASGIQVLGTIAMSWTEIQEKRRKWGLFALVLSILGLLLAYVAVLASAITTVSRA